MPIILPSSIEQNDTANTRYIRRKIAGFPKHIQKNLCYQYDKIHKKNSLKDANLSLLNLPTPAADPSPENFELIAKAEMNKALEQLKKNAPESEWLRAADINMHRRKLRKKLRKEREREEITFNGVNEKTSPYSSRRSYRDMKTAEQIAKNFLKTKCMISNDCTKIVTLDTIAEISAQNHSYEKRGQIMAMAEIMEENDWIASFAVISMPSKMHKNTGKNGTPWNGTMPDEAHQWANKKWQQIRAILSKEYDEGVDWMSLRTVEPHMDACPHYNLITIGTPELIERHRQLLYEKYLYDDDCDCDKASEKHRIIFNIETTRTACRQIASYASKYALKTYMPADKHKTKEQAENYEACKTWRQNWSIRAFSFIGFAPSGIWRECRAYKYKTAELKLVEHAKKTNFKEFHFEYFNMKQKHKIEPIKDMVKNKYKETINKIVGHCFQSTIITIIDPTKKANIIDMRTVEIKPRLQLEKLNQGQRGFAPLPENDTENTERPPD